ncbi:MAG TPA: ABC transporter substrate-binding protein [Ignavibacteriaceae bacterium]|nr:ABC transporter substrate-binding protein [Ignavibacteriaceae bacterium]
MSSLYKLLSFFLLIFLFASCSGNDASKKNTLVIGVDSDVESLNPLFAYSGIEPTIAELLYPSLVKHSWDDNAGEIKSEPWIAEYIEWLNDSSAVKITLKDVKWSDGKKITPEDVKFSLEIYSNADLQSRFYGTFENFKEDKDLRILIEETFTLDNENTFTLHFKDKAKPSYFDFDFPILPAHAFNKNNPKEDPKNIYGGPFVLDKRTKEQSITLKRNKNFSDASVGNIEKIIFKVIPDYNTRILQLKNSEIDICEDVKPDDADELKENSRIKMAQVKGREYDYIGLNNNSPLFKNVNIRKGISYSINKNEILGEFLLNYGELANAPVAPVFKGQFNKSLQPINYNINAAKSIFTSEGWKDNNKNGILEKGGEEFSFTMYIPAGNPRRDFAANVIKNNLKEAGIDLTVQQVEPGTFFDNMFQKKYDCWMAGWVVPIPTQLEPYFHSGEEGIFNLFNYSNKDVDKLLEQAQSEKNKTKKNELYKLIQEKIYNDSPIVFLYWIDNLVFYNSSLKNVNITPLGALHNCWQWSY